MTPLQRKYFGKKHKAVKRGRKRSIGVVHTARRRSYRRSYSRASGRVGGFKSMIAPLAGGIADNIAAKYIPQLPGVGAIAAGIFLKSNTTRDIGLYSLGHGIGNMIPILGGGSAGGLL